MPIGKGRERKRGRRAKTVPRDPSSTEAYEHGWYMLLARRANGDADLVDPGLDESAAEGASIRGSERHAGRAPQLAPVTERVAPSPGPDRAYATSALEPSAPGFEPSADDEGASATGRLREPGRSTIRIGVRRLEDPESVYLRYLTASPHRDFFRNELWPACRSITPVHLWRANHLGAGWDIVQVERFMDVAAKLADELIGSAPRSDLPGTPERRAWIGRFLSAEWVREFGIGRVSKTLLPTLPDLVPDLDPTVMSWARGRWLGLHESAEAEEPEQCLESWELLEDALVLRGQHLGGIVRQLHRLAPSLAPIGSLGLILAAFWDDLWAETNPADRSRGGARRRTAGATAASGSLRIHGGEPTPVDTTPSLLDKKPKPAARSMRKPAGATSNLPSARSKEEESPDPPAPMVDATTRAPGRSGARAWAVREGPAGSGA